MKYLRPRVCNRPARAVSLVRYDALWSVSNVGETFRKIRRRRDRFGPRRRVRQERTTSPRQAISQRLTRVERRSRRVRRSCTSPNLTLSTLPVLRRGRPRSRSPDTDRDESSLRPIRALGRRYARQRRDLSSGWLLLRSLLVPVLWCCGGCGCCCHDARRRRRPPRPTRVGSFA